MEAVVQFAGTLGGIAEPLQSVVVLAALPPFHTARHSNRHRPVEDIVAAVPPLHTARNSSRHVFAAPFCL